MSALLGEVATHVVRQHRHLRRSLPDLRRLADVPGGDAQRRHATATTALRFLDDDVLAHADIEDAVLDDLCDGPVTCADLDRLRPTHDTVRIAEARLRDLVEQPDDGFHLPGFLLGLHDLLEAHLEDEWRTLLPLLVDADEGGIARLQERFPAGLERPSPDAVRACLHSPYEDLVQLARGRDLDQVTRRLARAAATAVRQVARSDSLPMRNDVGMRLELHPIVTSPRVLLMVGRLTSAEIETVVAPVDVEITFTPGGIDGEWTQFEMHHSLRPRRRLPSDAPARHLGDVAIQAISDEVAALGR